MKWCGGTLGGGGGGWWLTSWRGGGLVIALRFCGESVRDQVLSQNNENAWLI